MWCFCWTVKWQCPQLVTLRLMGTVKCSIGVSNRFCGILLDHIRGIGTCVYHSASLHWTVLFMVPLPRHHLLFCLVWSQHSCLIIPYENCLMLRCRVWMMLFIIDLKCSRWFSKALMLLFPMLPAMLTSIAIGWLLRLVRRFGSRQPTYRSPPVLLES